ncbi:hypothetical protein F5Y19DRAFT_450011 [Xylariaceae sp. FL1651]|nr:hypothetical protein F5Y19DRAFT_450011 [Xylariaceae sp. FL1651]
MLAQGGRASLQLVICLVPALSSRTWMERVYRCGTGEDSVIHSLLWPIVPGRHHDAHTRGLGRGVLPLREKIAKRIENATGPSSKMKYVVSGNRWF